MPVEHVVKVLFLSCDLNGCSVKSTVVNIYLKSTFWPLSQCRIKQAYFDTQSRLSKKHVEEGRYKKVMVI